MNDEQIADRLARLRAELADRGLAGFVVPLTDEHHSEYVPAYCRRLEYLTGFSGSAGQAIVLADRAAIFVDGRYTLQARRQVPAELFDVLHVTDDPPLDWLATHAGEGDRIGYDAFLHTPGWVKGASTRLAKKGAELVATDGNPVDAVWDDQPGEPLDPAEPHPLEFAGEASADKRARLGKEIAGKDANAAVIAQLDSIAWLLNIRGRDVAHTPVAQSFVVLDADGGATLFIHPKKVTDALREHLGNEVALRPKHEFIDALEDLGAAGKRVMADPATSSAAIFTALEESGATIVEAPDPCMLPKSRKNAIEIIGAHQAHVRDGAAVSRFLHWLNETAPAGEVDEIAAAERLAAFREETGALKDLSFDTISGAGPNGAVIHYHASPETNRKLENNSVYLVDSGAQYLDGTTDITRTVAIGDPGPDARQAFTRVLKGHISLATAVFPEGTTGPQLDSFARRPLWEAGLDYDHGTGHGVGSYLAVHEGPGRIAKWRNEIALEPGMIFSNEPGYYKEGHFGIRIENLVLVAEVPIAGAKRMLGFETLTLAPIDRNMVAPEMLTGDELGWLNAYHERVREALRPYLDGAVADWLDQATAPLAPAH